MTRAALQKVPFDYERTGDTIRSGLVIAILKTLELAQWLIIRAISTSYHT